MAEPLCSAGDQAANLIPPPLSLLKVSLFAVVMWRFCWMLHARQSQAVDSRYSRHSQTQHTPHSRPYFFAAAALSCWYAAESVPLLFAIGSSVG